MSKYLLIISVLFPILFTLSFVFFEINTPINILHFILLIITFWLFTFYIQYVEISANSGLIPIELSANTFRRIVHIISPLLTVFFFSGTITLLSFLLSNFFAFKDNELYWLIIKGGRIVYRKILK